MIVDLCDKINPTDDALNIQPTVPSEIFDEALSAMIMLGFTRVQSQKALKKIFDENPEIKVENAIKKALSMM